MKIGLLILFAFCSPQSASQTPQPDGRAAITSRDVKQFFDRLESRFSSRDTESLIRLYAADFQGEFGLTTRETVLDRLGDLFDSYPVTEFEARVRATEIHGRFAAAIVSSRTSYGKSRDDLVSFVRDAIWILYPGDEGLLLRRRFPVDGGFRERYKHGVYTSLTGGYSIAVPTGWVLIVPREAPGKQVFDLVWLYNPDSESIAVTAVVDLPPRGVSARDLAQIENINMEGSHAGGVEITAFHKTQVGGETAWETVLADRTFGGDHRIRRLAIVRSRLYYTIYFQSNSEEHFAADSETFDEILSGIRFSEPRPTRPGNVEGTRFAVREPACEIQVPPGWRIAPTASRYLFRAMAVPPAPDSDSLVQFFAQEIDADQDAAAAVGPFLKSLVAYLERSVPGTQRLTGVRPSKVSGVTGLQIVLHLPAPSHARRRKIAVFGHEATIYVFFCDAIPPAKYTELEPAFDKIIESFKIL